MGGSQFGMRYAYNYNQIYLICPYKIIFILLLARKINHFIIIIVVDVYYYYCCILQMEYIFL